MKWSAVSNILKNVDVTEDAESIRHMALSYATKVALSTKGAKLKRAVLILDAFADNFYDSKRAGLVLACFNVVHAEG